MQARRNPLLLAGLSMPLLAALSLGSGEGSRFRYTIVDLGTLGGLTSVALDINEIGWIVGSADVPSGLRHAYVWDMEEMTDLGTYGSGTQSEAWAINNLGMVVGGPLMWVGGQVSLIGENVHSAYDVNDAGQIVGDAFFPGSGSHAFIYENGVFTDLGTFGGSTSLAWAINESGQVAGAAQTTSGPAHAFFWSDGQLTDLGTLGGTVSGAQGVNDSGHVIGTSRWTTTTTSLRGFLWKGGEMIDVDGDQSSSLNLWGINSAGQIVGWGRVPAGGEQRGLLFDPIYGRIDLQNCLPAGHGWSDLNPRDINDAGQIVGAGTNPQGIRRAFLMNPLPAIPAANGWALLAAALLLAIAGTVLLRRPSLSRQGR